LRSIYHTIDIIAYHYISSIKIVRNVISDTIQVFLFWSVIPYSGKILEGKIFRNFEKNQWFPKIYFWIFFNLFLLYLEMALLKYLTLKWNDTTNTCSECLPDASGPLGVVKVLEKQQKQAETKKPCGEYLIYIIIILSEYIHMV